MPPHPAPGLCPPALPAALPIWRAPWFPAGVRGADRVTPEPASALVETGRRAVAGAVAGMLAGWSRPVLVDDSQMRSEEHTSELQSRQYLVCRLLLEKKRIHRPGLDVQVACPPTPPQASALLPYPPLFRSGGRPGSPPACAAPTG